MTKAEDPPPRLAGQMGPQEDTGPHSPQELANFQAQSVKGFLTANKIFGALGRSTILITQRVHGGRPKNGKLGNGKATKDGHMGMRRDL